MREIAGRRATGQTWVAVAAGVDMSERHCRRLHDEYVEQSGHVEDLEPEEVVRQALAVHISALDDLLILAATADNSSAAVGAIRSRVTISHDLLRLMSMVGMLPPPEHAARLRLESEKKRFVCAVIDALDAHGIDYGDLQLDLDRALRQPEVPRP